MAKRKRRGQNSGRDSSGISIGYLLRHADRRRGWREGMRGLYVTAPNVVLCRQVEEGDKTSVRGSVCAGQSICDPKRSPLSVNRASHDVRRQTNRSPIAFRFRLDIELRPQRARLKALPALCCTGRRNRVGECYDLLHCGLIIGRATLGPPLSTLVERLSHI